MKLLKAAGVKVNEKIYPGVSHEFFGMGAVVDKARDAVAVAAGDPRAAFSGNTVTIKPPQDSDAITNNPCGEPHSL